MTNESKVYADEADDRLEAIIRLEQDDLPADEVVELFQSMIDDSTVWQLQGVYRRMAHDLIVAGYCHYRVC